MTKRERESKTVLAPPRLRKWHGVHEKEHSPIRHPSNPRQRPLRPKPYRGFNGRPASHLANIAFGEESNRLSCEGATKRARERIKTNVLARPQLRKWHGVHENGHSPIRHPSNPRQRPLRPETNRGFNGRPASRLGRSQIDHHARERQSEQGRESK